MKKVGRNDQCPCGSGKKYKKCHGAITDLDRIAIAVAAAPRLHALQEAREHQRSAQQGLGRPIIATKLDNGVQFVAIKNRLLSSQKWRTFHDFLIDYLKSAMGTEWGKTEIAKPDDQKHPVIVWYQKLCEQQRILIREPGKVASGKMTGAVTGYLHMAYDLYALDHNADLQEKLVERLRSQDLFHGALHEVRAAAILTRAGFTIEFEDEDDRGTSHCEFTATSKATGKKFSVEAKRAESGRITRQLVRALKKRALHTRIVFIELNSPDPSRRNEVPEYVKRAFDLLRRFEALDPQAKRLPPAYVFMTNTPWEHHLDTDGFRQLCLADGFHLDDFKLDHIFPNLRAAIDARGVHIEMHDLIESMRTHSQVPATFDGQNPEFVFGEESQRLIVGERYIFQNPGETELKGVLTSAVVIENERVAACALHTEDDQAMILKVPLSDIEMAAWKRHPETFFGDISRNKSVETPLELYDFFLASYKATPKAMLIELIGDKTGAAELAKRSQPELASIYSERMAIQAFNQTGGHSKPPLLVSRWKNPDAGGHPG